MSRVGPTHADIKLIENNAHVGAQVASAMAGRASSQFMPVPSVETPTATPTPLPFPRVIVFGSAAIDITAAAPRALVERTTTPGTITLSPGGVGRNIAHAAQKLLPEGDVQLIAAVGGGDGQGRPDRLGLLLQQSMAENGLRTDGLQVVAGARTAACNLVLENSGDLVGGVADMAVAEALTDSAVSKVLRHDAPSPTVVAFDCNLACDTIESILIHTKEKDGFTTFADPTSVPKFARLLPLLHKYPRVLDHITPNALELDHMYSYLTDRDDGKGWEFVNALNLGAEWRSSVDRLANRASAAWMLDQGVVTKMIACLPWVGSFWLKGGAGGLLRLRLERDKPTPHDYTIAHRVPAPIPGTSGQWLCLTYHAPPMITPEEIVSTTGAGDTLAGSLIAGISLDLPERVYVADAIEAVGRTLRSADAVA